MVAAGKNDRDINQPPNMPPETPASHSPPTKNSDALWGGWHVESFNSSMVRARVVQATILSECQRQGFNEDQQFAIRLALEEALVNAIKHGNQMDPAKIVRVRYRVTPESLTITIEDEGPGFNPATLPDPTTDENLQQLAGRGILLMRAYMDSVDFSPKGNSVTITKQRHATEVQ